MRIVFPGGEEREEMDWVRMRVRVGRSGDETGVPDVLGGAWVWGRWRELRPSRKRKRDCWVSLSRSRFWGWGRLLVRSMGIDWRGKRREKNGKWLREERRNLRIAVWGVGERSLLISLLA